MIPPSMTIVNKRGTQVNNDIDENQLGNPQYVLSQGAGGFSKEVRKYRERNAIDGERDSERRNVYLLRRRRKECRNKSVARQRGIYKGMKYGCP